MVLARYSESSYHLQFGVQNHHLFSIQNLEPPSLFSLTFRATIISWFGVQSHHFLTAWHSEPPSHYSLAFKATISSQFGVQSHGFSSTFRAIISSVWHSDPCLQFDIQSHFFLHFSIQSHHIPSSWHSVSTSLFSFDVQSHCAYSFQHFESPLFLILAFKVIFPQPYHLESQLLAFIFTSIVHLAFTILHSSSFSLPCYLVLIACPSCSSRLLLPLHMTQSFEFMTHISVMLLGTLHLVFSCSSHWAVPSGRILSCTPRWFDRYSSLTLIFESLLETSQRKPRFIVQL